MFVKCVPKNAAHVSTNASQGCMFWDTHRLGKQGFQIELGPFEGKINYLPHENIHSQHLYELKKIFFVPTC